MERGTVSLTNSELTALYNLAISQGCQKDDLVSKLKPDASNTDQNQVYTVQISEDDAEVMLDCLPIPSEEVDPNLTSSRIKIQQFISRCRFGSEMV
ncbi:MAG: hypothetical protein BroJett025_02420 [Patescibacteria group bacterium]|nr:MAG: hypothetical protein BroJett025_02420 [Patescibacteria group bacterium]